VAAYVAFNGWNDLFDPVGETTPMRPSPLLGFNNTFLLIQDRLWDSYRRQDGTGAERGRLAPPRPRNMSLDEYAALITDVYLRNVDRMHAFARGRDTRFLLVLQPEVGSKPLPSAEERHTLARWDSLKGYVRRGFPERYAALRKAAGELCRDRGIACLDMASAPEFRAEREWLFIDTVHLNERGHRLAADLIEHRLRELP
jgi:lysophospholipase L1-like esterase